MMPESMATLDDRRFTKAGQTECFSVLMDRHMSAAKRCISLIVRRTPDIEDILQNTLFKGVGKPVIIPVRGEFSVMAYQRAMNEAFAHHRYQRCRPCCRDTANLHELACILDSPERLLQQVRSNASSSFSNSTVSE
jgi:DNA-directed RNA polymerase specialized sigma24 family protein